MSNQPFGGFNPNFFAESMHSYFNGLDTIAQGVGPMMGPIKAMARFQLEMMGLASRRAQAVMEVPSRLARCRTPQDIMSEQSRFWQTAFHQYAESSRRVMEAWTQAMQMPAQGNRRAERDYISFADPREANGQGRAAQGRFAA
jgi:hypothetical protein